MSKVCKKCKAEKSDTEFYINTRKCKECTKSGVKDNYRKNVSNPDYVEKERKRGRDKYYSLYRFTSFAKPEAARKHILKYPEKRKATNMSASLTKPYKEAERHHWSYNEEHFKDVIWLTKRHHMKAHRFIVYDQSVKMYRRYDTNDLLATKEAHEKWILTCIQTQED